MMLVQEVTDGDVDGGGDGGGGDVVKFQEITCVRICFC